MPKVTHVKSARKDHPEIGVKKGAEEDEDALADAQRDKEEAESELADVLSDFQNLELTP